MKIYCKRLAEVKREKRLLERKLNAKILITKRFIELECSPIEEYEAQLVFDAINLGFPAETAVLLTDENFVFKQINMKDYTRRKNLNVIRGLLIGTHGRTKNTVEQISGCQVRIHDNMIGIIGPAKSIEYALNGVISIIRGTRQTSVYKYLERINTQKKKHDQG